MKKVLLITDVPFWFKAAGHHARISSLVEYLSTIVELKIIYLGDPRPGFISFIPKHIKVEVNVFRTPRLISIFGIKRYVKQLKTFLNNEQFDSYIIEYIHLSYLLKSIPRDAHSILDAHDIISDRANNFRKFNFKPIQNMSIDEEAKLMSTYSKVMLICRPDYQRMKTIINPDKLIICPHPAKIKAQKVRKEVKTIGFIASNYLPNKDGILYFLKSCWPDISANYHVQLAVYGNVKWMIQEEDFQNVSFMGYVHDINQIYENIDIIVNPVRFGAGLKIKNIEAMSFGKPIITSTHGTRGFESAKKKVFIVADTPADFVDGLSELIENYPLRKELSKNSISFVKEYFSIKKCFEPLKKSIFFD